MSSSSSAVDVRTRHVLGKLFHIRYFSLLLLLRLDGGGGRDDTSGVGVRTGLVVRYWSRGSSGLRSGCGSSGGRSRSGGGRSGLGLGGLARRRRRRRLLGSRSGLNGR